MIIPIGTQLLAATCGLAVQQVCHSCILYPAEDITKILYWIQFVISDIGEDGHEPGKANTGLRDADKETVVAVLRYPAYLTFEAGDSDYQFSRVVTLVYRSSITVKIKFLYLVFFLRQLSL